MKRNNLIIRLAAAVCTLAFLCAAYFTSVSAVSGFDKDRKCSITITMLDSKSKTPVGDGTMTLYHVGDIDESMNFILMGDFKNSGISLSDLSDRKKAEELISFVKSNSKIKGTTRSIDSNGIVRFASLSCGLYLLEQATAADGRLPVRPFLLSVPLYENGSYIYDISANPKTGSPEEFTTMPSSSTNPSDTTTPGSSTNPSDTTAPDGSTNPNATTNPNASTTPNGTTAPRGETTTNPVLPNTGQMNWPIPTFAGAGLMFLLIGFLLKYSRKEEADET